MKHNYITGIDSAHYAVSPNCTGDGILIQLGNDVGEQVRIPLMEYQAMHLIELLQEAIKDLPTNKKG